MTELVKTDADTDPTVDGFYVCWLLGSPLPRVLQWRNKYPRWQWGVGYVTVDAWLGPLPK